MTGKAKWRAFAARDVERASAALSAVFAVFAVLAYIVAGTGCAVDAAEAPAAGGTRASTGGAGGTPSATGGTSQVSSESGGWQGSSGGSEEPGGIGGGLGEGAGGNAGGGTGGGTTSTDVVVEDVPAGLVCARLSELQCEAEASCCTSPTHSLQTCKTIMAKKCAEVYLDQVSKSSLSGYAPRATGLVMAELERRAATCDPTLVAWGASVSGLRGIFPGTRSQGSDCTPKSLLDGGDAAAHLMACRNPEEIACLPGGTWKCTARSTAGGPCFSDTNCRDGLYCDNPQTALTGATCKTRKAVGAACKTGSQCASLVCKARVCVPADSQTVYCLTDE